MKQFCGRVHKFGDDINTDYIISSRRKRDTLDMNILKQYIMEDISPDFAGRVKEGDILVAGDNFGCGSAMEVASLVVKAVGINVVLAKSFARAFFRNGVNGGLLLVECDTQGIEDGDCLEIRFDSGTIGIFNKIKHFSLEVPAFVGIVTDLVEAGGLVEYLNRYGNFKIKR